MFPLSLDMAILAVDIVLAEIVMSGGIETCAMNIMLLCLAEIT